MKELLVDVNYVARAAYSCITYVLKIKLIMLVKPSFDIKEKYSTKNKRKKKEKINFSRKKKGSPTRLMR